MDMKGSDEFTPSYRHHAPIPGSKKTFGWGVPLHNWRNTLELRDPVVIIHGGNQPPETGHPVRRQEHCDCKLDESGD